MCGIYACLHYGNEPNSYEYKEIDVRGPDDTKVIDEKEYKLVFHRLAIVGINSGSQPFNMGNIQLMCNGEIYNYKELIDEYKLPNKTGSDCEVILHMYKMFGLERTLNEIRGEFAFILINKETGILHFARDPIGIKPLFMNTVYDNNKIKYMELASLVKGFSLQKARCEHVLPGTLYTYDISKHILNSQRYLELKYVPDEKVTKEVIYEKLEQAVIKRIKQTERPFGFFLSGGIDSCTTLSIAMKSGLLVEKPYVFTFGFHENAPDVINAKVFVNWLKNKYGKNCIEWHLVIKTVEEGLSLLPEVIRVLETYDTTTIRASTPMYMLSRYIRDNTNVKVLLSGEGSDELFGGYLYNLYTPNKYAFRSEIINALNNLYVYDVLRADRSTSHCGLEVRPPFLDIDLINTVLKSAELLPSKTTTKKLLRDIIEMYNLLPDEILYGRKEAFSDAVGLNWLDSVKKHTTLLLSEGKNEELEFSPHIKPKGNTEKYFQTVFSVIFPNKWHLLPKIWLPNQDWVNTNGESSARALSIYTNPENKKQK